IDCDDEAIALGARNLALNPELAARVRVQRHYLTNAVAPAQSHETLDHLVAQAAIGPPDFLKIDVEGAELAVLQGARETLRSARPNLIVETHGEAVEAAVAELLLAAGYRVRIVTQRRWLREGRPLDANRWLVAEAARG